MSDSLSSSSGDSDEQKAKPRPINKVQAKRIKQFNMNRFMNLLEEFGINERVLIKYEELELEDKIGEGGFGEIYLGKWLG